MVQITGSDGALEPIPQSNFALEAGSLDEALLFGFMTFTPPKMSSAIIEYHPGSGQGPMVRKVKGGTISCDAMTITKAIVPADQLDNMYAWFEQCNDPARGYVASRSYRRTLTLHQYDNTGAEVATWTIFNAWISAFKLGDLDGARGDTAAVEEITIECEGFKKGGPAGLKAPFSTGF